LEFLDVKTELKNREAIPTDAQDYVFSEDVPWLRRYLSLEPRGGMDTVQQVSGLAHSEPGGIHLREVRRPAPPHGSQAAGAANTTHALQNRREVPGGLGILDIRPRFLLPYFCAMLVAINLGAMTASRLLLPAQPEIPGPPPAVREAPVPFEDLSSAFLWETEPANDVVTDFYLDRSTREEVTAFFARICGSPEVADVILKEAVQLAIPPSLAFAVSWEESRFVASAVNPHNRDGSVDRGLFQLNSNSFPKLGERDFFNPQLNAQYGISHLRMCLDTGGSEIAALAIYNAGSGRVQTGGTPRQTLDYVARVLSTRRKIDRVFLEEMSVFKELAAEPEELSFLPHEN
jgi:hypothetical protein